MVKSTTLTSISRPMRAAAVPQAILPWLQSKKQWNPPVNKKARALVTRVHKKPALSQLWEMREAQRPTRGNTSV